MMVSVLSRMIYTPGTDEQTAVDGLVKLVNSGFSE